MIITICPSERAFDETAAWRIIAQILSRPNAVIGLSTGQTTTNMHAIVSELYALHPFDTSGITLFNVDELTNLPRTFPGSCYDMIRRQIAEPLGIPPENFVMPPTYSDDFPAECVKWETELARRGGADLQMLGIGWNGHIGINQPGTPFERETWVSPMDPVFEARIRQDSGVSADLELGGLTRGIVNIMQTRRLILIAKGEAKASIIRQAIRGPVTTELPASVVQLHPNCEILLDGAAASLL